MSKLSSFFLLALFGLAIANPLLPLDDEAKLSPRIVGGLPAKRGQFPYQVSLQNKGVGHFCGASVLSEKWILTAAHCVPGLDKESKVVVGTSDLLNLETSTVKYDISKVIPHPEFNIDGRMRNDLALIKIQDEITFSVSVKPIKLPESDLNVADLPVVASGWGRLKLNGLRPTKLRYLESKVFDHDSCKKRISTIPMLPPVGDTQICTFMSRGKGLCHGDSGGPIVADGYQVGIVSMGYPCAQGYPDINTHVWKFVDWIKETMQKE